MIRICRPAGRRRIDHLDRSFSRQYKHQIVLCARTGFCLNTERLSCRLYIQKDGAAGLGCRYHKSICFVCDDSLREPKFIRAKGIGSPDRPDRQTHSVAEGKCKFDSLAFIIFFFVDMIEVQVQRNKTVCLQCCIEGCGDCKFTAIIKWGQFIRQRHIFGQVDGFFQIEFRRDSQLFQSIGSIDGRHIVILFNGYQCIGVPRQKTRISRIVFDKTIEYKILLAVKEENVSVTAQLDLQLGGFIHIDIQRLLLTFAGDGKGVWVKYDRIHLGAADRHVVADHEVFVHIHTERDSECGIAVFFDFRAGIFFAGTLVDGDQRNPRQFRGQRSIVGIFHRGIVPSHLVYQGKGTHIDDTVNCRHHLHVFQHDTLITQRGIIKSGGRTADLGGEITTAIRRNSLHRFVSGNCRCQCQAERVHRRIGIAIDHDPPRHGQHLSGNKYKLTALTQFCDLMADFAADAVSIAQFIAEGNDRKYGCILRDQPALFVDIGGAFGKEIALAVFPADGKGILGQDGIVAVFILCLDQNDGCFRGKSRDGLRGAAIRTVRLCFVRLRCARVFFVFPVVGFLNIFVALPAVALVVVFVVIIIVAGDLMSCGFFGDKLAHIIAGRAVQTVAQIRFAIAHGQIVQIDGQRMSYCLGCGAAVLGTGAGVGVVAIGSERPQLMAAVGDVGADQCRRIFIGNACIVFLDLPCRHGVLVDMENGKGPVIIEPWHGCVFFKFHRCIQAQFPAEDIDILQSCDRDPLFLQLVIQIAA